MQSFRALCPRPQEVPASGHISVFTKQEAPPSLGVTSLLGFHSTGMIDRITGREVESISSLLPSPEVGLTSRGSKP